MRLGFCFVGLWVVACNGDKDDPVTPSETGTVTDPTLFSSAPQWRENTDGASLLGFVDLATTEPTTVTVEVDDGVSVRTIEALTPSTSHEIRVLGLRADTVHALTVTATASGRTAVAPLEATTAPLPADFPIPELRTSDPTRMEPGVTLLSLGPYLQMLDAAGQPAWYMPNPSRYVHEATITPRGTLLVQVERELILELSLTGAIVAQWRSNDTALPAEALEIDALVLHHDIHEMPNGNFLSLSVETRSIPNYPTSETDELAPLATATVAGDIVVEFSPAGAVIDEWPLLDLLDPYRITYDGLDGDYWETFFGGDVKDWSHANSVWYDAARDEVVVSLRHQDAVVGLDHATGDITWILSPQANWDLGRFGSLLLTPEDPTEIEPYHQHGVKVTPDGTLLMFDNGNYRASPWATILPAEVNFSRGLEVAIDHSARTWTVVWAYGETLGANRFSGSEGDCDALPSTGNRLITYGNIRDETQPGVELFELTGGANPEIVWDLAVPDQGPSLRANTFRAQRLTDVIPGR